MVEIAWIISLAVQIWSHIYTEAATCLTKFDIQLMCPQYSNGTPLITNSTKSALACGTVCSSDIECRSFQYNPNNNECRTNAEKLTKSSTSCLHQIRYGEIRKANCRGNGLFEPCIQHNDCTIVNTSCLHGRCECSYGHPYDYRTNSCPAGCTKYGSTLHEVSYYLQVKSNDIIPYIEIAECHARCYAVETFVCRLIAYYKHSEDYSMCRLFELNAITAPPNKIRYENSNFFTQWDRNCD